MGCTRGAARYILYKLKSFHTNCEHVDLDWHLLTSQCCFTSEYVVCVVYQPREGSSCVRQTKRKLLNKRSISYLPIDRSDVSVGKQEPG